MNGQLKKRVRKLIREHFESKFGKGYEQSKDMYRMFGVIDEVIDKVTVIDLISSEDATAVATLDRLISLMNEDLTEKIGTSVTLPVKYKGKVVNINISFD